MPQIGETVSVSLPSSDGDEPVKVLVAELESVEFDSSTKICMNQAAVSTPHWQNGVDVSGSMGTSKRPAVLLFEKNGGVKDVQIEINILVSENVSGSAKLSGSLGALEFEGTVDSLSAGIKKITAQITNLPNEVGWYKGNASFGMEVDDLQATLSLGSARLEVFVVFKQPSAYYQSKDGVWAEVLRFLCSATGPGVAGKTTEAEIVESVVRYCHTRHKLKYDSAGGGGSHYGVSPRGGQFKLKQYLKRFYPFANCYDQAAAVQALSGAMGVVLTWIFLNPFGFIKIANLLGYGACNNPFFLSAGLPQIVGNNDPDRTAFGNHAFAGLGGISGNIADACAGPHVVTETASEYVVASIDSSTTLYSLYRNFRAGTKADMTAEAGVTSVV